MINTQKLFSELICAGVSTSGCNAIGIVWDLQSNEIQTRPDVAAIIAAHTPGSSWDDIRTIRNSLISSSDWTQISDAPLSVEEVQLWKDYRQELRDIPQTFSSPDDVIWPEKQQ